MSKTIRPWLWLACVAVGAVSVQAQSLADRARLQGDEVAMVAATGGVVTQEPPVQKEGEAPPPQSATVVEEIAAESPVYEETVVVTASKVEQQLVNAPATISVLSSRAIENLPAQNYGDLLRRVPGLNVSQTSARDINITARGATSTLATSQLALLDGRSLYLDFFGFIAWDFMPVSFNEIKQVEVIRGPASAVWGANALNGVINVITKSPREMDGTSFTVGFGGFSRSVEGSDEGAGTVFYVNGTHAQAVNDRWAYKVSGGAYTQDPLARPTGTIPNAFHTPYPPYANSGTTQPKFDARADYDFTDGRQKLVFAGGLAGTEGIIHSGIGPFDIASGSLLGYVKTNYSRGPLKVNFFANLLDGQAPALLSVGLDGQPIQFSFKNQTYDFEVGNANTIGTRQVLSYGGNVRFNAFDLSIAPLGDSRSEGGAYIQDELFLSDYVRLNLGARIDKFSILKDAVFSPRTTLILKPRPEHAIRLSYNRAYRAPSLVNNYIKTTILNQIDLGLINPALAGRPYIFPTQANGNDSLREVRLDAYEIGYTGTFGRVATVSAAFYYNKVKDDIYFTQVGSYRASGPPPGWPLPPLVLEALILNNAFGRGNGLPSVFSYANLGESNNKGFEIGIDTEVHRHVNVFANYAYQAEPVTDFDEGEINLPPTNIFNAGIDFSYGRYVGGLNLSYVGEAFWQDVLDARFHGTTDAYSILGGTFGVRWANDRVTTTIKLNNITNADVQQHVFGDIMKFQAVGELKVAF